MAGKELNTELIFIRLVIQRYTLDVKDSYRLSFESFVRNHIKVTDYHGS